MKLHFLPLLLALLSVCLAGAAEDSATSMKAPPLIELPDQFERLQRLVFPSTKVVVLTIADHKGSEEIADWVAPLKSRYGGKVEIRGMADVRRVPGLLRSRVRKKFQEKQEHPVMMDWSGTNCAMFSSRLGVANILIIGLDGSILCTQQGKATEEALKTAFNMIDTALLRAAASVSNKTASPEEYGVRETNSSEKPFVDTSRLIINAHP